MKKYFSILIAVLLASLSFSLTSCGDDDDEPGIENGATIIGKWILKDVNIKTQFPDIENEFVIGDLIEFKTNGTVEWTEKGVKLSGKYTYEDNEIFISDVSDGETIPFIYNVTKLTGSELVFNADLMIVKATYTLQRDK